MLEVALQRKDIERVFYLHRFPTTDSQRRDRLGCCSVSHRRECGSK